ncbi:hypothetical protein GQ42DRAFT_47489 [Ramicandelaber brevisporus]|nr:hypothetical protein GQ42DRAFT_47489 [Ramicandelaber brevisporus]
MSLTWTGNITMDELFTRIEQRLSEGSWVVALKTLILIHIMLTQSNTERVYSHLGNRPHLLDPKRFTESVQHSMGNISQARIIAAYSQYLSDKVALFRDVKIDFVRERTPANSNIYNARSKWTTKGLLHETASVQKQIHSLVKVQVPLEDINNEVTFSAFRYLVRDLLRLFQVMNEGVIRILKSYFEMNDDDMKRALELYKRFVRITERVSEYLRLARMVPRFGGEIPSPKHAPLSLAVALEEYYNTPQAQRAAVLNAPASNGSPPPVPQKTSAPAPSAMKRTATSRTTAEDDFAAAFDIPSTSSSAQPPLPARATAAGAAPDPLSAFDAAFGDLASSSSAPQPSQQKPQQPQQQQSSGGNAQQNLIDFFASIEADQSADNAAADEAWAFGAPSVNGDASSIHTATPESTIIRAGNKFIDLSTLPAPSPTQQLQLQQPQQQQQQQAIINNSNAFNSNPFAAFSQPQPQPQQQALFNVNSNSAVYTSNTMPMAASSMVVEPASRQVGRAPTAGDPLAFLDPFAPAQQVQQPQQTPASLTPSFGHTNHNGHSGNGNINSNNPFATVSAASASSSNNPFSSLNPFSQPQQLQRPSQPATLSQLAQSSPHSFSSITPQQSNSIQPQPQQPQQPQQQLAQQPAQNLTPQQQYELMLQQQQQQLQQLELQQKQNLQTRSFSQSFL